MTRPRMHGGYTSTYTQNTGSKRVVYWTCQHELTLTADVQPLINCPTYLAMTDSELQAMIKSRNLVVEPAEAAS